jgi:hypothetical protein
LVGASDLTHPSSGHRKAAGRRTDIERRQLAFHLAAFAPPPAGVGKLVASLIAGAVQHHAPESDFDYLPLLSPNG